jgi:hypothetical protein
MTVEIERDKDDQMISKVTLTTDFGSNITVGPDNEDNDRLKMRFFGGPESKPLSDSLPLKEDLIQFSDAVKELATQ